MILFLFYRAPFRLVKNSTWGAQLPFINWESITEQHQPINGSVTLSNHETGHLSEKLEYGNYAILFFPGLFFIIFSYFGSFMVVWGLGSYIWFLGLGFSVDGVWGLLGIFWLGLSI